MARSGETFRLQAADASDAWRSLRSQSQRWSPCPLICQLMSVMISKPALRWKRLRSRARGLML